MRSDFSVNSVLSGFQVSLSAQSTHSGVQAWISNLLILFVVILYSLLLGCSVLEPLYLYSSHLILQPKLLNCARSHVDLYCFEEPSCEQ